MLRLILRVQMVEVAEKLIESVHCRKEVVSVTEMVLAELSGGVALWLEQFSNRRIECR